MSIEEAIKHCNEVADSYNDTVPDCECASYFRQLAGWLQELKERREAEMRMNRVWKQDQGLVEPKPISKLSVELHPIEQIKITAETLEAVGKLAETIERLPEIIREYIQRKEESK